MKSPIIFRVFKDNQIQFVKQFLDKDNIVFGSAENTSADVDVNLESQEVSTIHCLVEKRGTQFFLCDLGSTQGTFVKGQKVLDQVLQSGDEFQIGPFRILFFMGAPKPVQTEVATGVAAPIAAAVVTEEVAAPVKIEIPKVVIPEKPIENLQSKPQIDNSYVVQKPSFRSSIVSKAKKQKGQKTFAPVSQRENLNEFVKPGQGGVIEIIVSWKERVLNTYHFQPQGQFKSGPSADIQLPEGAAPKDWVFVNCSGGVIVCTTAEMKVEVHRSDEVQRNVEANYKLNQNEVVFIELINGMQIAIRFAPKSALVPLDSPLIFSSSEFTGILAALIIATLTSLIVSVLTPKKLEKEEDVERVAQVIFNKPPIELKVPPPPPPVEKPEEKPPEQVKKPEPPKKIVESNKQQEQKTKGDVTKPDQKAQVAQKAGRANEVAPKDPKLTKKIFTSTKQGGAIKTGDKAGANAKSKNQDPSSTGLLSAFGGGGAQDKLNKAYSGTGELLGDAQNATGSSGFNKDRAGDGLGSAYKDTGAGGKGTATQGIAGIGTKGRGTGMSAYGSGNGFGEKDQVGISAGGAEEDFVGTIDREAVRRVVRSALSAFKACYDREYKSDTRLEGKVVVTWEIHERGVAKNARIVGGKSTIDNAKVEECVRLRMLTLRFPEPPAGTVAEVTYPFLFQGQK